MRTPFSLTKVLEVERFLENSIATTFFYLCIVYTLLVVAFAYLSIPFSHAAFVVGLLIASSMYVCVSVAFILSFLMLKDIICVTILNCI